MRSLSSNLIAKKNELNSSDPWLVLLEITLNDDDGTVFRLVRNNEDVTFEGEVFTAFSFEVEPFEYSSEGNIPTLTVRVTNISRLLQPYMETLNGGVGSTVKMIVINSGLLLEDYSDFEETFEVLSCVCDVKWVTFSLGSPSPMRKRMPLYRYLALHSYMKV